jgi:hypothetical protein
VCNLIEKLCIFKITNLLTMHIAVNAVAGRVFVKGQCATTDRQVSCTLFYLKFLMSAVWVDFIQIRYIKLFQELLVLYLREGL